MRRDSCKLPATRTGKTVNDMATYWTLMYWQWFLLNRRIGFWAIIGIVALTVVGTLAATVGLRFVGALDLSMPAYGFPRAAFGTLSTLAPFLGVALAGFIFGSEFGWGTWRALLARNVPVHRLLLARMMLGVVILVAVWLAAWCLASAVGLAAGRDGGVESGIFRSGGADEWGRVAAEAAGALPVAIVYLALGGLLCVAGRSTAFGVGVGMGIVAVEMVGHPIISLVADLAWNIQVDAALRWTLWGATRGLLGNDDPGPLLFLPAVVGYAVLMYWLTLAIFQRRDLHSGNG